MSLLNGEDFNGEGPSFFIALHNIRTSPKLFFFFHYFQADAERFLYILIQQVFFYINLEALKNKFTSRFDGQNYWTLFKDTQTHAHICQKFIINFVEFLWTKIKLMLDSTSMKPIKF